MLLVELFYQFVLPPAPCLVYTVSVESINRTIVGPGEICFVSPRIRRIVVDTFRIFSLHLSLVVGLKKAVLLVFQYSAEHGREERHGGRGGCSRFRHETLRFRMSAQKGETTRCRRRSRTLCLYMIRVKYDGCEDQKATRGQHSQSISS